MPDTKDDGDIWELRKGDILIGTLEVFDTEDFWYKAHFVPTQAFEPYRAIFSEGREILSDGGEEVDLGNWVDKINDLGMLLIRLRWGWVNDIFILYINDDQADFRV